ncbi:MAG: ketoacyl-ACP synthase III [Pseudomonadales bacterium]|nr:ketoacyl-ACP synthase III [Pseudomonadales bacterium]
MNMTGHSKIASIGTYLPEQEVTSQELMDEIKSEQNFGIPNTWLEDLTGIKSRRFAAPEDRPSDLAIRAGRTALEKCGMDPKDIGMVLYCGIERDWVEPATSHRVQRQLGCVNATCLDVSNACHGFSNGMSVGDAMIATGAAENVLVVTGEVPNHLHHDIIAIINEDPTIENFNKKVGSFTAGDGGGAVILQRASARSGIKTYRFNSRGRYAELCWYQIDKSGRRNGEMAMDKISGVMIRMHQDLITETYEELAWKPKDVDHLICHQVGSKPHHRMAKLAGISLEKAPTIFQSYGNLTSATIPVTLETANPAEGDRILILGAGSGLSISQIGLVL